METYVRHYMISGSYNFERNDELLASDLENNLSLGDLSAKMSWSVMCERSKNIVRIMITAAVSLDQFLIFCEIILSDTSMFEVP